MRENIYLSSRIDGAIEVLKKSKLKEEELKNKKSKEKSQVQELIPDPAKERLAAIFEIEKKYQDALKARHA